MPHASYAQMTAAEAARLTFIKEPGRKFLPEINFGFERT
jgi:hypothetical protein